MMMSAANQAYVFLATVYGGLIIGFFFDIYRMIRRILRPGKWLTGVMDLIFWILMAIFSFLVLLYINYGQIRLYSFLGLGLGWGLYILSISQLIMWIFDIIYRVVSKILSYLFKLIRWPFKKLYQGVKVSGAFISRHIKNSFKRKKEPSDRNMEGIN